MADTKALSIQRNQAIDSVIIGTMVGAALGGVATWFLSREENRKKAANLWDEVRDETIDYANFLFRKTRALRGSEKKLLHQRADK